MLIAMQSIIKHIEIVWLINGIDGYGFGNDKQLYNLKTERKIKQSMNCCSIGFWIGIKQRKVYRISLRDILRNLNNAPVILKNNLYIVLI